MDFIRPQGGLGSSECMMHWHEYEVCAGRLTLLVTDFNLPVEPHARAAANPEALASCCSVWRVARVFLLLSQQSWLGRYAKPMPAFISSQ
jgi:hypothetical protein